MSLRGWVVINQRPAEAEFEHLANTKVVVYTGENLILVGRWTSWNKLISPSVNDARPETWYPCQILAARGQIYNTKPGFAPILIAVLI